MIKKSLVNRKLSRLQGCIDELRKLSKRSLQEYGSDSVFRRAVERLLQITVECAIDCNNLIIVGLQHKPVVDSKSSFTMPGDLGVLDNDFSRHLVAYVKTRNLIVHEIVHEYEKLNDEQVYAAMQSVVVDFRKYRSQVTAYLSQLQNSRGGLNVEQQRKRKIHVEK